LMSGAGTDPFATLVHRTRDAINHLAALVGAGFVAPPPNIPDIPRRRASPAPTIIHDLMDAISRAVH
jgi:hypothetical protein